MTDTELLHEVEQAMLGAMMTRPRRAGGLPGPVAPELFADRRHQAIAAALTGSAGEERGLLGRLRGWFARFGRRAREDRAYLETLPAMCPDAAHMESYFDILRQARSQREARARAAMAQAADAAQILEGAADQLAVQTGGAGRAVAPGELPDGVARQARALAGYARQLSQAATTAPARPGGRFRQARPGRQSQPAARWALAPQAASGRTAPGQDGQTVNGQVLPAAPHAQQVRQPAAPGRQTAQAADTAPGPRPSTGGTSASGQDSSWASGMPSNADQISRRDVQDLLLAALMRDTGLAREIVASLPADRFEDGPRRELYTMIAEFVAERRPLDPLLLAWAADQRSPAGPHVARDTWVSPDYIRRLAHVAPIPGKPAWLGQLLLNDSTDTPAPRQPTAREPEGSPQQDENRTADTSPEATRDNAPAEAGQKPAPAPRPAQQGQRPAGQTDTAKPTPAGGGHAEPAPPGPALVEAPPPDPSQAGMTPRM